MLNVSQNVTAGTFRNSSNLNKTNTSESASSLTNNAELNVWSAAVCTLSIIGAFLNILILLVVWPHAARKSTFSLLLFHMAIIQLTLCVFNGPSTTLLAQLQIHGFRLPPTICNYIQTAITLFIGALNWSDADLAVNRCVALFFPHFYPVWTTKRVNFAVISVCWLASAIGCLAPSFKVGFSATMKLTIHGFCGWLPEAAGMLGVFSAALRTAVPYIITGVGAFLIAWKTWRLSRSSRTTVIRPQPGNSSLALHYRLKLAKMLVLTFLWTALCVIPYFVIVSFYPRILLGIGQPVLWFRLGTVMQYGFTPCILFLVNDEYRKQLAGVLRLQRNINSGTRSAFNISAIGHQQPGQS